MDWNLVKKMTLWNYEELIERMCRVFSYGCIQEHYDHNMREATDYVRDLLGYDVKYAKQVSRMTNAFKNLNGRRVENYTDLIREVENKEKTENFLRKTRFPFEDLIFTLNYIFRWVLPHSIYLRELIDVENKTHSNYIEELKRNKIKLNLDILEQGRTRKGREKLSEQTGIPTSFILELVNLADMSRLPYSNRKTVKHLLAAGYNSVAKLAQTDSEIIIEDMKLYFNRIGIKPSGFIDLKGIANWAKTMPTIVES